MLTIESFAIGTYVIDMTWIGMASFPTSMLINWLNIKHITKENKIKIYRNIKIRISGVVTTFMIKLDPFDHLKMCQLLTYSPMYTTTIIDRT